MAGIQFHCSTSFLFLFLTNDGASQGLNKTLPTGLMACVQPFGEHVPQAGPWLFVRALDGSQDTRCQSQFQSNVLPFRADVK